MTEKQELRKFIKTRFPIGSVIQDWTCSEPYTIKKYSVFVIHCWVKSDYNPDFLPDNDGDYEVEFLVHDPGIDERMHYLCCYPKNWCLERYKNK